MGGVFGNHRRRAVVSPELSGLRQAGALLLRSAQFAKARLSVGKEDVVGSRSSSAGQLPKRTRSRSSI